MLWVMLLKRVNLLSVNEFKHKFFESVLINDVKFRVLCLLYEYGITSKHNLINTIIRMSPPFLNSESRRFVELELDELQFTGLIMRKGHSYDITGLGSECMSYYEEEGTKILGAYLRMKCDIFEKK